MAESKTSKLELEINELKGVIGKLSIEKDQLISTVGILNRKIADLESAIRAIQQWAKNQNDANQRYANTERY